MTADLSDPDNARAYGLNLLYREAYGRAADRLEAERCSLYRGKRPAELDRIAGELARERGIGAEDAEAWEAIREGVEDAKEGRRPRW